MLAALSTNDEAHYDALLRDGWVYWNFRTNRHCWESWRLGDRGTTASAQGPVSLDAAYAALRLAGIEIADPRRCFVTSLRCLECTKTQREIWCSHDVSQIIEVAELPSSVEECAIFGSDPDGVARAERAARVLKDQPTARIVWRTMSPVELAYSVTEAHIAEQAPLLDLGYALDPYAYWDDGISLVAPDLSDG